jgi:hypothetical protein
MNLYLTHRYKALVKESCWYEQSSYSAMLNIVESVPPPSSSLVQDIPVLINDNQARVDENKIDINRFRKEYYYFLFSEILMLRAWYFHIYQQNHFDTDVTLRN